MTVRQQADWLARHYIPLGAVGATLVAALLANRESVTSIGVLVPLLLLSYLTFRNSIGRVEDANEHLEELNRVYLATVETLAAAIDTKDQITHGHIRRVQRYAIRLAQALAIEDEGELKAIEAAALLHDIGKLAVPEFILNKPGKLTDGEYARIKQHAPVGASILSQIDFPYPVVPIVRHHHENWDGTGYPDRLAGEEIPIGARIMAVVDCYDALTSDRPYRPALTSDEATAIILERRGKAYDPRVVDAFLEISRQAPLPEHEPENDRERHALIHEPESAASRPEREMSRRPSSRCNPMVAEDILLLSDAARKLAGRARLDDVAELMSRHLKRIVPSPLVVFYLVDEERGDIVAAHASGAGEHLLHDLRIPFGHGSSGWVAANRTPVVNSDPALDLGDRLNSLASPLGSTLAVPLLAPDSLIGVLSLYAPGRDAFTGDDSRVVGLVAGHIAGALNAALAFERDLLSLRDSATGLPNERSLRQVLASSGLLQDQPALSFCVISLDGERHGGAAPCGRDDDLVMFAASAARRVLRATDFVFRFSEREIVVLMPDTDAEVTRQIASRVAHSVAEAIPEGWESFMRLGLAFAPHDGRELDVLVGKARARLEASLLHRVEERPVSRAMEVH